MAPPGTAHSSSGLVDLRGAVHVHTRVSHDSPSGTGSLVDAAHSAGLAWVALTEHTSPGHLAPSRGVVEGVRLIPGYEVSAKGGSVLAIGVTEIPSRSGGPRALVDRIHEAGGVAILGHMEGSSLAAPEPYRQAGLDGIEIVNLHAVAVEHGLSLALGELLLPAPFALRVLLQPPLANLEAWTRLQVPSTVVGGVDAHQKFRVLGPLGGTLDRYNDMFRLVTTHVLATDSSEKSILDALRARRSYVAFEGLARVDHLVFEQDGQEFALELPAQARFSLVCDGRVADEQTGRQARLAAPVDASLCHVEAWLGQRLWVLTSERPLHPAAPPR